MDDTTLERLADLICGDDLEWAPVYRKGTELTSFFHRAGISASHDGSTRKWWTLEVLRALDASGRTKVIKRLASPKEYGGNAHEVKRALDALNQVLRIEGYRVSLDGIEPKIGKVKKVSFDLPNDAEPELVPLPPPAFHRLGLDEGIGELLAI